MTKRKQPRPDNPARRPSRGGGAGNAPGKGKSLGTAPAPDRPSRSPSHDHGADPKPHKRRRRRRSSRHENGSPTPRPRGHDRFAQVASMVPNVTDVSNVEPPRSTRQHADHAPQHDLGDADLDETPELGIGTRVVEPHLRYEAEIAAPSSEAPPRLRSTDPAELEAQIRALEARLDGLIRRAAVPSEPPPPPSIGDRVAAPDSVPAEAAGSAEPAIVTRDKAATEYVERQWGREALRSRLEEVDDFGLDPSFESKLLPGIDLLYRRYFRVQVEGIHHVPSAGRAVIVANHGGTLPLDGAMLRTAIRLDHPSRRDLRWLAEDFVFYLPFAGVFLNRIGAVRACPENAERLLEKDSLVAVFPEGVHGIKKLFRQRYQLQRFGRGGFIRLCLRMRAPLIPCAIIGAEETNPLLYRLDTLAELWKLPYLPITPTFPLLGPIGLMPAPTRWKLRFGEPISFDHYGPEALDDHVLVGRLAERVRSAIQGLLDSGLSQRKSVWFG